MLGTAQGMTYRRDWKGKEGGRRLETEAPTPLGPRVEGMVHVVYLIQAGKGLSRLG